MSQRNERLRQPDVTHWLIHHAAHRTPESLSSRLEEEWLADVESRSSALTRLRFALGCGWATLVIVSDYPRSGVQAASPAVAARGFITLADRNFGYFSLRSGTLFLIAGLHAALSYVLLTTLSHTHGLATPPNLENHPVNAVPPEKSPAAGGGNEGLDARRAETGVDVPPKIDVEDDATAPVVEKSQEPYSAPLPPETPIHVVQRVGGRDPAPDFRKPATSTRRFSIHLGEEGFSTVRVCRCRCERPSHLRAHHP